MKTSLIPESAPLRHALFATLMLGALGCHSSISAQDSVSLRCDVVYTDGTKREYIYDLDSRLRTIRGDNETHTEAPDRDGACTDKVFSWADERVTWGRRCYRGTKDEISPYFYELSRVTGDFRLVFLRPKGVSSVYFTGKCIKYDGKKLF